MEKLIKLNEIVKKVNPDAFVDVEGGISIALQDKSKPYRAAVDAVAEYYRLKSIGHNKRTTVKIKDDKFIFNLHGRGIKLHINVGDDDRIEELVRMCLKPINEFTPENFGFIFNNMKKGRRVSADIDGVNLIIKIRENEVATLNTDILKSLYVKGKLLKVINLGSIERPKSAKFERYKYTVKRLMEAGLEQEFGDRILPIDGENKIITTIRRTGFNDAVIVHFSLPSRPSFELRSAVLETYEDVERLFNIIKEINSIDNPEHKVSAICERIFGYNIEIYGENITLTTGSLRLKYNKENYSKILRDIEFIEHDISGINQVAFRGGYIINTIDIISGETLSTRISEILEKKKKESKSVVLETLGEETE